ncbi:MAG: hypothetical protein ABSE44_09155 [Candidatus Sulfotelmatobacter sp.]|jgi:hypothetical protein
MGKTHRVIAAVGCLLVSLCVVAQVGGSPRKIVLPNPRLIHCRSVDCSQLWKQDSGDGGAVYPAQILTDVVDGEIVGLTAVYDKSVSTQELQAAVDALYSKSIAVQGSKGCVWRVEPEQLAIQLSGRNDGATQLTYLKFVKYGELCALVPSAHIDPSAKNVCGK